MGLGKWLVALVFVACGRSSAAPDAALSCPDIARSFEHAIWEVDRSCEVDADCEVVAAPDYGCDGVSTIGSCEGYTIRAGALGGTRADALLLDWNVAGCTNGEVYDCHRDRAVCEDGTCAGEYVGCFPPPPIDAGPIDAGEIDAGMIDAARE
jgi:hypothetical protein